MNIVPRPRPAAGGFTLIELMVIVAIIAILTAIALPIYTDYVTRSKLTEAFNNLAAYRVNMEQYYQDNRSYGTAGACGVSPATASSGLKYFAITCNPANVSSAGAQGYTASATGDPGTPTALFTYTIDNLNAQATTNVPPGWGTTPSNCWIKRKGGDCQ